MEKFIVNLFSNRFGIILAALNVCCFVSKENITDNLFGKLFVCANIPAAISALLSVEFINFFSHDLLFPAQMSLANTFFTFFIVLQWLFIAKIAETLAAKIRKPRR